MNLPNEIIREIILFLPNEDVFNMYMTNKHINNIFDKFMINNIIYRDHPLIFNVIGNFCMNCNLKLVFLSQETIFGTCNHIN